MVKRLPARASRTAITRRVFYCFGEKRVATLALLTFTALSRCCSCGVTITKVSDHAVMVRLVAPRRTWIDELQVPL